MNGLAREHGKDRRPPEGLRRQLGLHSPFATRRARFLLTIWAMLTLAVLAAVVAADLERAESQLDQIGGAFLQHVSDRALVSETAIEGFAAFVASLDTLDQARAREYARTLLERYRFLYMFEVATRVSDPDRPAVEQAMAAFYPGFHIKRFSYTGDRRWEVSPPAPFYYPLVFQEPLLPEQDNLYGLDLNSSDFLKAAMEASFARGRPVATHPFDLAEGGRGYVLHRAVDHLGGRPPSAFEAAEYALLALKSAQLFSALDGAPEGVALQLRHRDFTAADPAGEVYARAARPVSATASWLLPRFEKELSLDLASQPFDIGLTWQLGWTDLNLVLMAAVLIGSLAMLWGVRGYAQQYIESELAALENGGRLYELANFDSLTGLANRNRLMDFLEAELARARRHRQPLAVLFIDLDGFKAVNDSHGHLTGDLILVEVARRLEGHLRADELLARYGGDEFVWVTGEGTDAAGLGVLVDKLRAEFDAPFVVRGQRFNLGVSIGHAVFPGDGRNIAALFDAADAAMYRDKRGSSPAGEDAAAARPAR